MSRNCWVTPQNFKPKQVVLALPPLWWLFGVCLSHEKQVCVYLCSHGPKLLVDWASMDGLWLLAQQAVSHQCASTCRFLLLHCILTVSRFPRFTRAWLEHANDVSPLWGVHQMAMAQFDRHVWQNKDLTVRATMTTCWNSTGGARNAKIAVFLHHFLSSLFLFSVFPFPAFPLSGLLGICKMDVTTTLIKQNQCMTIKRMICSLSIQDNHWKMCNVCFQAQAPSQVSFIARTLKRRALKQLKNHNWRSSWHIEHWKFPFTNQVQNIPLIETKTLMP